MIFQEPNLNVLVLDSELVNFAKTYWIFNEFVSSYRKLEKFEELPFRELRNANTAAAVGDISE